MLKISQHDPEDEPQSPFIQKGLGNPKQVCLIFVTYCHEVGLIAAVTVIDQVSPLCSSSDALDTS